MYARQDNQHDVKTQNLMTVTTSHKHVHTKTGGIDSQYLL
jgi:hypothetical protein